MRGRSKASPVVRLISAVVDAAAIRSANPQQLKSSAQHRKRDHVVPRRLARVTVRPTRTSVGINLGRRKGSGRPYGRAPSETTRKTGPTGRATLEPLQAPHAAVIMLAPSSDTGARNVLAYCSGCGCQAAPTRGTPEAVAVNQVPTLVTLWP